MITPSDIFDQLKKLVGEEFPGETIYEELVPKNFDRPSTLIVLESCTGDVAFGCNAVEIQATFSLTTYVPVDEYYHSHLAALHLRQMRILKLLLPGFIKVGERAPKVQGKIELDGGFDFDTIKVTYGYTLDRNDFMNIPQLPIMTQLHMNQEVMN